MGFRFLHIKLLTLACVSLLVACGDSGNNKDPITSPPVVVDEKTAATDNGSMSEPITETVETYFAIFKPNDVQKAAAITLTLVYENNCIYGKSDSGVVNRYLLGFEAGNTKFDKELGVLSYRDQEYTLPLKVRLGGGNYILDQIENFQDDLLVLPECGANYIWRVNGISRP